MANYYDIEKIKEIPITDIAERLEIEILNKNNSLWVNVRNEKTPSCKLYLETNTYCDFGNCNKGGDVISFVSYAKGITNIQAIDILACTFNIEPTQKKSNYQTELLQSQYAMIDINCEVIKKNFNMSIDKLKEENKNLYKLLIEKKSIPFIYELRQSYFYSCYSLDKLATECGIDILNTVHIKDLENTKNEIENIEKILINAIKGIDNISFKPHSYNVKNDIQNIRTGKINIEFGNTPYNDLKAENIEIKYIKISEKDFNDKILKRTFENDINIKYTAFIQGDKVNIAYFEKDKQKLQEILQNKNINTLHL